MTKQSFKPPGLIPPHSQEAELAVLGAILLNPQALDQIVDILIPQDFYCQAHALIYQAMLDLYRKGQPVDLVTVHNLLAERGQLEAVGGPTSLAQLTEEVGFAVNAGHYAILVRNKAIVRQVLQACQDIARDCFSEIDDLDAFLDVAEQKLFGAAQRRKSDLTGLKALAEENLSRLESLYYHKQEAQGLLTGYRDYDKLTAGLHSGELTILAARPGMGKTSLALNIAWHVASHGHPTAIFSLEMSKEQVTQRLIAAAGDINADRLRQGRLTPKEWATRLRIQDKLENTPLWIDDTPGITLMALRARCRRLKAKHGLALAIVDYLQLMCVPRLRSREEEVSCIAYGLKNLAKELALPIMAICQVSREIEKRNSKKYFLSDLRESGAIEQAADNILFLHRANGDVVAQLELAKQRNGQTGTFRLAYFAPHCRFSNFAAEPNQETR